MRGAPPPDRPVTGDEIAIIGMAGRFPRARNVEEFWENLRNGVEATSRITADDLRAIGVDPVVLADPDYVSEAFALEEAEHFDAEFFGFSPREAELMDPQQRLFLEAARAALEHAGYDSSRYAGLIGVFGGVGRNAYLQRALAVRPELRETAGDYLTLIGNERDFPTAHVSYRMNLRGPSIDVQTACSTSGVALHLACQSLRSGDCDIALAGGCKLVIPNREGYWYVEGGPLAPEGHIRAFDADAKGMVRGSGAGMLVLKRLEEALADGDTVYAVVLASAVNNDGAARVGFTAPSVSGQAAVIAEALAAAAVSADTISYVETHGTGTVLGDPIEVAGLTEAFRRSTARTGYCAIGSVKTNIGHLDAGATAAGLIKTVLALRHELRPPSLNYTRPNPQIDFAHSPFFVNAKPTPWPRGAAPRRAGVSSFGLGGTNAHIILEEAPSAEPSGPGRPGQLLLLSAKSEVALEAATDELAEHLAGHPDQSVADVAYTLQVGRRHWAHRRAVVCGDAADAIATLRGRDPRQVTDGTLRGETGSLVYMFPGGGTQYPGMAAGLTAAEPTFRAAVEECARLLSPEGRSALRTLLEARDTGSEPDPALERPSVALPALFAVEYALARLWASWGLAPAAMIGHSMGEYTAACLAGVFSLEDALRLVVCRGRLFERLSEGGMVSVPLSEAELRPLLGEKLSIAAINKPGLCVASGPSLAIDELIARLEERGSDFTRIHISVAAHSQSVEPILQEFGEVVAGIRFSPPAIPFVSNVTGTWITGAEATDPAYWVRHLRQTVRFADGLDTLLQDPTRVFLEVGPGQTLSTFARQHPARRPANAVISSVRHPHEDIEDHRFLLQALGRLWVSGLPVDWEAFRGGERRRRVGLPTYPFQRRRYSLLSGIEAPRVEQAPPAALPAGAPAPAISIFQPPSPRVETTVMAAPAPSSTVPRRDRIIAELRKTIRDLSGMDEAKINVNATFLELGFDSLFLAQANGAFKKTFKVKLTTRHLLEKTPTITALAEHLDKEMPADAFAAPVAAPTQSRAAAPAGPQPGAALAQQLALAAGANLARLGAAPGGLLEAVIAQQLQIMQAQLAALGGAPLALPAMPALAAVPAAAPAAPAVAAPADFVPVSEAPEGEALAKPDKSSPWQPVAKTAADGELTKAQQAHLDALMARVISLTPKSKALTQENRPHLSDPRTVQGFRKRWKEMVYPIVSERAKGSRIWDVDGNEYIDLVGGYGVTFFGHSPKFILDAVRDQLKKTVAIGPQTPLAGEVAKLVCELTGMERAAFCNTGSEAVLAAIRVARTVTGKTRLACFAGHYHGIFDEVLVKGVGTGPQRRPVPISPGIPPRAVEDALVLEYDNPASLDVIRQHADEIALVMVEPVRSRNLDRQPREFLQALRKLTAELGIPLLFDEMITGFRSHPGGAQAIFGVKADLATYGKVIGGEFPIGVVAGKREYLDALDGGMWSYGDGSTPEADMTWFAGTFVRHPVALAAARAALQYLKEQGPQLQEDLNRRTAQFVRDLNEHFRATNAPVHLEQFSSIFIVTFTSYQEYSPLLFYHLRNRGVYTYEGRPAFFTLAHTDADMATIATALKESVAELQNVGFFAGGPVRRPGEAYDIPLSEGQQEIWLATQLGADASRAFNLASTLRLRGALRVDALQEALRQVVQRHEALRAVPGSDGQTQRILPKLEIELPVADLSALAADERDRRLAELKDAEVETAFDLVHGPLVRARLAKLAPDHHFFVITAHHMVCDGWSCGVLLRDLGKLYEAACTGLPAELGAPMQLSEFVRVSAEAKESPAAAEAEAYWLGEFPGVVPVLELPTDRPRPPRKTFRAKRIWLPVDAAFVGRMKQLAAAQGATMFATLLAGFGAFLKRLSGQDDLVVGFSLAAQSAIPDCDLVGHCVKFLPLHLYPRTDTAFSDFLHTVRGKVLDAIEYQNLAFGGLLQKLKVRRDPSRVPLMSVAFNLDPSGRPLRFHDLEVESGSVPRKYENFDIFFNLVELGGDRLEIQCTFNLELFDEATMWRRLSQYVVLMEGAAAAPGSAIGQLPILSEEDHRVLSGERRPVTADQGPAIHDLFERQAARTPDAVAVTCGGEALSYRALDARANQLAHRLQAAGVTTESLVGLLLDRSLDLVVGVLGILKAGGAYVPVDASNPPDRVASILGDAAVEVVVTSATLASWVPAGVRETIRVDADAAALAAAPVEPAGVRVGGANAAYVIYTSGSTGKPKGVVVTHRNVVRLFEATRPWFQFGPTDVWTLFHSIAFDVSVGELWGALFYGGRLVVVPQEVTRSTDRFHDLLASEHVTVLRQTPSAFRMLSQVDASLRADQALALRHIIFAGEALDLQTLRPWIERHGDEAPQLINMYGITETTVDVTYRRIRRADLERGLGSVIGEPIPDLFFYILDERRQPVPIGVPGEICVGGAGVARGYLNRPELTAERFVPDPFARTPGARMYRSGDQARWLADGDVEYLGRLDDQVKIRGFRIELGEIRSVVRESPHVKDAAVVAREDMPGEKSLVAYVIPRETGGARQEANAHLSAELREFVRGRLPEYMVPTAVVTLDALPLTPNGKLDVRALPRPDTAGPVAGGATGGEPRTDLEREIATVWMEILHLDRVGVQDNFFERGGHSLLGVQVMVKIRERLGVELSLGALFEAPTIEQLATRIEALRYVRGTAPAADAKDLEAVEL
jgi:amino acid adenylation domain-containing protein